jgi:hypothetical protein
MITSVRPYFKKIMKDLGLKEWRRSLEPDNIPKTLLDQVFHIKTTSISGVKQNQRAIDAVVKVDLSFATKGLEDEVSAYEKAEATIQSILTSVLGPVNKSQASGVLNIVFDAADPAAIGPLNDNILISRISFTCSVVLDV